MNIGRPLVLAFCLSLPGALEAQDVASVEVRPAEARVDAGGSVRFQAVARDAEGNVLEGLPIHWLATPYDVAGADSTGRVETFRPGRVHVFALVGGVPGRAMLEIEERGPAELEVEAVGAARVLVGDILRLRARAYTRVGDPLKDIRPRWRSRNPEVATVSRTGVVRGVAPGTATIVAAVDGARAEAEVRVRPNRVASISIEDVPDGVRVGDVVHLSADPRDEDGRPVPDAPLRWSVSGSGSAIDAEGRFVAERSGSHPVTARVADVATTAAVDVEPRRDPRRLEAVARAPLPAGIQAAEIWPIGDVAYVSTIAGAVYVFDISDPATPTLADSLIVDARLINDVSTNADGTIGVLAREGASDRRNGLVFFDASDPLHPRVISEFSESVSGGVHSAFVYDHYVFATDDATGSLRIIDFSDPRNPEQIARWELPREGTRAYPVSFLNLSPQRYLHDVYVEDGLAYLAYWRDGLVILDVGDGIRGGSIRQPKPVSRFQYNHAELYPADFIAGTHAVYRSGRYVFIGDESYPGTTDIFSRETFPTRGLVHVIDVSDIERPRKVAEYDPVEFGAHNFRVEDDVLYMGAYDGGIRVLDVSGDLAGDLRAQGREIGRLDTGAPDGFRPNTALAWSAIPHRGYIFASDINTGLWVARLVAPPIP